MCDNLDERNTNENTEEDADSNVNRRRRQRRSNSNEEENTETPHVSSTQPTNELNTKGHRHALPGNKQTTPCNKNREIRNAETKVELQKKDRVIRPRRSPQQGGSQSSQESA